LSKAATIKDQPRWKIPTSRQRLPRRLAEPFGTRQIDHACVLPLPAVAFTVLEAPFAPGTQTVSTGVGAFRR